MRDTKAYKEFRRIANLVAFTIEGYSLVRENQYGSRYYFDDNSVLRINDKQHMAECGIKGHKTIHWIHGYLLAYHPARQVNGRILPVMAD